MVEWLTYTVAFVSMKLGISGSNPITFSNLKIIVCVSNVSLFNRWSADIAGMLNLWPTSIFISIFKVRPVGHNVAHPKYSLNTLIMSIYVEYWHPMGRILAPRGRIVAPQKVPIAHIHSRTNWHPQVRVPIVAFEGTTGGTAKCTLKGAIWPFSL